MYVGWMRDMCTFIRNSFSLSLFLSVRTLHFDYMMPKIEADKELDASVGMTFCHMETHQTPTCLINFPHANKEQLAAHLLLNKLVAMMHAH